MTMAQIQHFLDIVNWGGFSAAASETFISQSSLSKQIKSLESELNVQLFDRTNNKIALTPGGTAFLEYARKLNNTYKAMLQDMEQYSSAKKTISMGILPLEQGYRLLERLTSYQVAMERVQVNITEDNQGKLIPLLDHGKLDFAVVRMDEQDPEIYEFHPIYRDKLVLVYRNTQEGIPPEESVSLSQLSHLPFVLMSDESVLHNLCVRQFHRENFHPSVIYTAARHRYLLSLVNSGLGVTILPKALVNTDLFPDLCCKDLSGDMESLIGVVRLKHAHLSAGAEHLYEFFAQQGILAQEP